jgi:two-component system chemotaxis response regulator CheB
MREQATNAAGRSGHDLIAIGASSGGIEALLTIIPRLPANLPAALCIVVHSSPQGPGLLPRILARHTSLPVAHATDGQPIARGQIYIAPPDHHLLVDPGGLRVVRGPRENRHRPAVDPLFRSAALAYGPRAVGIVLSGALNDGTAGLLAIKRRGGVAIIQDPAEALFPGMPASARRNVAVDYCLRLADIAPVLARLAREPAAEDGAYPVPAEMHLENRYARGDDVTPERDGPIGTPTTLTCPECHGPLWEIKDGGLLRFRCRTGHAFTAETMMAEQSEALEEALWMAVNTLEESALTAERLAHESNERQHHRVAARFADRARESRRRAEIIRNVIASDLTPPATDEDDPEVAAHLAPSTNP